MKTLSDGDSFGEKALLNREPRSATIICKTNCHFMYLDKEQFNQVLKENMTEKINQEVNKLKVMPLLSSLKDGVLKTINEHSFYREFKRGQTIYSEGEPVNASFIVI